MDGAPVLNLCVAVLFQETHALLICYEFHVRTGCDVFVIQCSLWYSLHVKMTTGARRPRAELKHSHCSGLTANADASLLPFI